MMLVVGPTGVGDGLGEGLGDGDGDGVPVAPVAPLGVGDGLGLGDGDGAPVAPVGPVGPVLEGVDAPFVSPNAVAGTAMYVRTNIKSVAESNPRANDFKPWGSDRPMERAPS